MAELLTTHDLTVLLRVDRKTIGRWCRNGVLPAPIQAGGTRRWQASVIQAWLDLGGPSREEFEYSVTRCRNPLTD